MTTVISVENLSKTYRLGQIGTGTFTHDLNVWWAKLRGQPDPRLKIGQADHGNRDGEELMALRDVSFTVQQGEVLGIIGRNGAGKSTLLKILSRVTAPTSGRIRAKGRVASLLEVGTGFHPELTGRENVYLNGAILGMTKAEVARKFDEIVDFAGVEKFIDTPVKRYSSGMYVRLAFAVAAHLDPEILVVDEVLAVGDAEFQKKCLGKMGEVAQGGRTVLFVSHNMAAVQGLCQKALLLDKGSLKTLGATREVIDLYIKQNQVVGEQNILGGFDLSNRTNPYSPEHLFVCSLGFKNSEGHGIAAIEMGAQLMMTIHLSGFSQHRGAEVGLIFKTSVGQWVTSITTAMTDVELVSFRTNDEIATLTIPKVPFTPGRYWIDISVAQPGVGRLDYVENAAYIDVLESDVYGKGHRVSSYFGLVYLDAGWKIEPSL